MSGVQLLLLNRIRICLQSGLWDAVGRIDAGPTSVRQGTVETARGTPWADLTPPPVFVNIGLSIGELSWISGKQFGNDT